MPDPKTAPPKPAAKTPGPDSAAAPRPTLATRGEFALEEGGLGMDLGEAYQRLVSRELPFRYLPGDWPAPDCNLQALARQPLCPPEDAPQSAPFDDFRARSKIIAVRMLKEDPATTALEFLHAQTVMALRRDTPAPEAKALFFRIWDELGADLAHSMPTRWRVSAAQCFADHGRSEAERSLGAQIALMFGLVKLYESERRFAGLAPWALFGNHKPHPGPLMMGLSGYALEKGDLAHNLLARLWRQAQDAGPMGQLALGLLHGFEYSDRGLLQRLRRMKERLFPRQD